MDHAALKTGQSGYLDVGDGHQLYYETYGNPEGIPVLYLHGGPGYGFSDKDKRFFDSTHFHAILFDQRGASRSKPYASLEKNTTQELVADISKVLDHFSIEKTILFGGSWGSTLALLYAIENPSRVTGMVLRGIFPATRDSINHFFSGAVELYYPEAWERFISLVPTEKRKEVVGYYYQMIRSKDEKKSLRYAFELSYYGFSVSRKTIPFPEEEVVQMIKNEPYKAHALMEAHYAVNHFFLPDNFIYNNLGKINQIPTYIIHGRFDVICPPVLAYRLHKGLPNASLEFVDAGHAAFEPEIEVKLKSALESIANLKK